jgi:PP-loop family
MTQLLQDLTMTTTTATATTTEITNHTQTQHVTQSTKHRPGIILTAHHANDSQETLLLKLLRGVHIQNLSGMAPIQQMLDGTLWGRPLMRITKQQILRYLMAQNYTWREDKYLRNRVRNELIPLMQGLVGGETALQASCCCSCWSLNQSTIQMHHPHLTHASSFCATITIVETIAKLRGAMQRSTNGSSGQGRTVTGTARG